MGQMAPAFYHFYGMAVPYDIFDWHAASGATDVPHTG